MSCMQKQFPELKVNGRKIESSADIQELIKLGKWDKDLITVAAFAIIGLWGENNQFAINLEKEYCRILRIQYTGRLCNGKPPEKNHKGKCISQIIVKSKGTLVGKLRNTCKKWHREAPYSRKEAIKNGTDQAKAPGSEKIPKLIGQIIATKEEHGFHGKLGICEGSKHELEDIQTSLVGGAPSVVTKTSSVDTSVSPLTDGTGPSVKKVPKDIERFLAKYVGESTDLDKAIGLYLLDQKKTPDDAVASYIVDETEEDVQHLQETQDGPDCETNMANEEVAQDVAEENEKTPAVAEKSHDETGSSKNDMTSQSSNQEPLKKGDRVSVWYPSPGKWYAGAATTDQDSGGRVKVLFDDGDNEDVDVTSVKYQKLEEVPLMGPLVQPTQKEKDDDTSLELDKIEPVPPVPGQEKCNHQDLRLFRALNNGTGYFKEKYLQKNKNYPSECVQCGKKFVDKAAKKVNEKTEYKVGNKTPVWACENADKGHHKCKHAFCNVCYLPKVEEILRQEENGTRNAAKRDEAPKDVWTLSPKKQKRGRM